MDQVATQQPISDDQELAKVLAGVSNEADAVAAERANKPKSTVLA